jgi:hypothetical protein
MKKQEEESNRVRELLEGQKKHMQEMKVPITGFDTNIDVSAEMVKMLTEEQKFGENMGKETGRVRTRTTSIGRTTKKE